MRHYRLRKWRDRALGWIEGIAASLTAIMAALLKWDQAKVAVRWGVLVIDSMNPKAKVGAEDVRRYCMAAGLLKKILEGI